nr:immunoglobulin heavy chain junction region [Mus musculus]MBK4197142.1 immunoglobulin heavy chain junction region [Mus musculus]MBK4197144.1 immunoglobulin heavy chain junction region [Mus musculus]
CAREDYYGSSDFDYW